MSKRGTTKALPAGAVNGEAMRIEQALRDGLRDVHILPRYEHLPDTEDLGLTAVTRIFPDTWNNISWVIVNAVTIFVD